MSQISETLTDAGARLDCEAFFITNRRVDLGGHRQLRGAALISRSALGN